MKNTFKKSLCLYTALVLSAQLDALCTGKGYFFMKQIPLTQGKFALVDDEDYEYLNQFNWVYHKGKKEKTAYAQRYNKTTNGKQSCLSMHREILGLITNDGVEADHKDGNGLNNQKTNLRIATRSQNCQNRSTWGISKYSGLTKSIDGKYMHWLVTIHFNKKQIYIGRFPFTEQGEMDAANAYNEYAIMYHREFAKLNILPENYIPTIKIKKTKQSRYRGVGCIKSSNKITAYFSTIRVNRKNIYLSSFPFTKEGERLAALCYNEAAIKYHGDKAKLNIIED